MGFFDFFKGKKDNKNELPKQAPKEHPLSHKEQFETELLTTMPRYFCSLSSLADEMPWVKEAVVNAVSMFDQLGIDSPQMLAKKQQYEKIMRENNWSADGMHTR
jgi:hypothetical protein